MSAISEGVWTYPSFISSSVFEPLEEGVSVADWIYAAVNGDVRTLVGGKVNLPPHGKEFFHAAVSSFLHLSVRTFLHNTVRTFLHCPVTTFFEGW